jgi:peptidoglycan hydrolase-like protein with peptidoglycan-binding domain
MATVEQQNDILRSFLGIREQPDPPATSNRTPIGAEFGWNGVPYCMETVWVVHNRLGLAVYPKTASVGAYRQYAEQGIGGLLWHRDPRVGSQVLLDRGGRGNWAEYHVGTVIEVLAGGATIRCIDGNWGGGVTLVDRSSTHQVMGYARVPFDEAPVYTGPTVFSPFINNRSPYVKVIQKIVGVTQDGVYGAQTANAVAEWQRKLGVTPSGVWDVPTQAATNALFAFLAAQAAAPAPAPDLGFLNAISAATKQVLRQGSTGDAVKILQTLLKAKGYTIAADGIFGTRTKQIVAHFQSVNRLMVDGVVGPSTWVALTR